MGCCKIPFRVWIAVMIFFSAFVSYSARANISMSINAMVKCENHTKVVAECRDTEAEDSEPSKVKQDTFDWDQIQQAHILGGFFYGYVAGSLFSGFISDWVGPTLTISVAVLITAIANSLCVWAAYADFKILITFRFLMGFVGSNIYPSLHGLVARWAPPAERGKFASCLLGSTLGTCFSWFSVSRVTEAFGWPWGFHLVTIELVVFLIIFFVLMSDYPDQNRWISKEEAEFIIEAQGGVVNKKRAVPPYKHIFLSVPFWAYIAAHFSDMWGIFLQLTEVPKYLHEVLGISLAAAGVFSNIPQVSRLMSGLFFGWFGDFLLRRELLTKKQLRKGFTTFSHLCPGIFLMLLWANKCNFYGAIGLLSLSLGFNGAATATFFLNNQDLAPNFAGTLYSFGILLGASSGFICPIVTGILIQEKNGVNEWGIGFVTGGCVYIVGGLLFMIFGSIDLQPWNEKHTTDTPAPQQA